MIYLQWFFSLTLNCKKKCSYYLFHFQVSEYNNLKIDARKQSALFLQELDSINREQKADQDRLDNELRLRSELENKIKQKTHEKEEAQKRVDKLTENQITISPTHRYIMIIYAAA